MRVIVTCERCDTRFHLDDAKVSATGTRVRCSRCKHAFLVLPPEASAEDTVHALALDAAECGGDAAPGLTHDLPAERPSRNERAFEVEQASASEEEWRFAEDDPPEARPQDPPGHELPREQASESWDGLIEEEKPPEERELDALGNPESWSFVSEEAPSVHPERAGSEPGGPPSGAAVLGRVALRRRGSAEQASRAKPIPKPREVAPAPPPSRAFERVGWTLTTVLLLAIVHGIAWGGAPPATGARTMPLGDGLVAEELSLQRIDSLLAGSVLVLGGVVRNSGAGPAPGPAVLKVRLVGMQRTAEAEASAPLPPETMRSGIAGATPVGPPKLLVGRLAPGGAVPFQAVIEHPPRGEVSLELELEAAPSPGLPEIPEAGAAATGDPSPPEPLPSSG